MRSRTVRVGRVATLGLGGILASAVIAGCGQGAAATAGAGTATPSGSSSVSTPASGSATTTTPPAASPSASRPASRPAVTPGGTRGAGTSASVPRCHTTDLRGSFAIAAGSEGAGNVTANITLRNTSSHACWVGGYPGMLLLGSSHQALPTDVARSDAVAARRVTLEPGGAASASARFSPDVPGSGDSQSGACQPTAHYVEITPPDETTHLVVTAQPATAVCERGTMQTSVFVAGTAGPSA